MGDGSVAPEYAMDSGARCRGGAHWKWGSYAARTAGGDADFGAGFGAGGGSGRRGGPDSTGTTSVGDPFGGDSKRLPHYSAFGKLFARVPHELPDGRASTLFDEFVVSLSGVPLHMHEGVVVASGDVLLMFDHMQLDFGRQGIVGVGMRVPAEVGTRHGVFVTDRGTGRVRRFLHKPSIARMEHMGALDSERRVDVDTGIVWMDPETAGQWVALADPGEGWAPLREGTLDRLVSEGTALNLYGDFLGHWLRRPCRSSIWGIPAMDPVPRDSGACGSGFGIRFGGIPLRCSRCGLRGLCTLDLRLNTGRPWQRKGKRVGDPAGARRCCARWRLAPRGSLCPVW